MAESKIFARSTHPTTEVKPRADATIRVRYYQMPPGSDLAEEYRPAQLLEYHPDWDNRLKFRSTAYIKPEKWMEHPAYERQGAGYLPDEEVSVCVREFMIHEDDRTELMNYCARYAHRGPLIIHPCARPFPLFRNNARCCAPGQDAT